MIRRLVLLVRALAALAVIVSIVVGVPAALVAFVGWPLPTAWPTLEQVRQFAQVGVSDQTIVKTLAVIVWIAWVQVALAIIVETVAALRRRAAAELRILPGLQPFAARLVAAIALVAAASGAPRAAVAAMPLHTVIATAPTSTLIDADDHPASSQAGAQRRAVEEVATTTVVTAPRDSWWRLAEIHLGDGLRWRELRDLNVGRTVAPGVTIQADTDQLDVGWTVLVPATTDRTDRASTRSDEVAEWEVQPGEHFWHIAKQTLTDAWGRPPTDHELTPYWRHLVEVNRDRLTPPHDPDLVHPGQTFLVPPPPADPAVSLGSDSHLPPQIPAPPVEEAPDAGAEHPDPDVDRVPTPPDGATAPRGWQDTIERHAPPEQPEPPDAAAADDDADVRNGLGVPVGLAPAVAATAFLAAGVTTLLRWRRRAALRQRPPGYRLPTPLRTTQTTVAKLDAAAPPEPTLDDLASLLASIPPDTHPALVTVVDDGQITLLFDDAADLPAPPPEPWTLVDDGAGGPVGWGARLGDRGPDRSIGLPLLVTLGRTGTMNVLANVAALPTLTLEGSDDEVRRLLRIMSLEAATSRIAVPVEVVVVGDDLLKSLDNVRYAHDATFEIEAAMAEIDADVVADDRTPRLIVCHPGTAPPDVPPDLIGTVGVLSASNEVAARWSLEVVDGRSGRLILPDGGAVDLVLPDTEPVHLDQELDELDRGAVPAAPHPSTAPSNPDATQPVAETTVPDHSGNGQRPEVRERRLTDPAWCEVRLLGPVEVYRDGVRVEKIPPRSLELLVYLVTHADGVSRERVDDAIWSGKAGRPGTQRVTSALTKLRNALGDGPDGEPLVPRHAKSERVRLSGHVGSDLDRALAHLALARDLPAEASADELAAALDLVRGDPLEDLPVSWGSEISQRAIAELQDAALELARIRRAAGEYDAAEEAVRRGLRLLDAADALYLELAAIEKARGRPDRVSGLWHELRQRHAADADEVAGLVSYPPPEIELAFRELIGGT